MSDLPASWLTSLPQAIVMISWSFSVINNHVPFQLALHCLQWYFRPPSLASKLSTGDLSSSFSEKIKAVIWTSQTKSVNLSAAIPSPRWSVNDRGVSQQRLSLCALHLLPFKGPAALSLLFIFIHIHSYPFSSFFFPSLFSLSLFIGYRLAQVYSNLKSHAFSSFLPTFLPFMGNILKALLPLTSLTLLVLLYSLTSSSMTSIHHSKK